MSEREQTLFKSFVEVSRGYFEFGMGGSTAYAAKVVDGPVVAVDSERQWIDRISAEMEKSAHHRNLIHVDIGATKEWGYPVSNERSANFPLYSSEIRSHAHNMDLCLVDGRFRVACFLKALSCLGRDAVLGIHDFRSRQHYHSVLDFARPIAEAEDMTFFVSRHPTDESRLKQAITHHEFDPR